MRATLLIVLGTLTAMSAGATTPEISPPSHNAAPLLARKHKKKRKSKKQIAEEQTAAQEAARVAAEEAAKKAAAKAAKQAEEETRSRLEAEAKAAETQAVAERAKAAEEAKKRAVAESESAVEAKGLDARIRRLADQLAREMKRLPGDDRDQIFAVANFGENGDAVVKKRLGLVVSDLLMTNLTRDHRLALTERSQLAAILSEQELGAMGAIEPGQAADIGKLAGARALVVGEVSEVGDTFKVSARLVDTENAQVLATASAALPKEELLAVSARAVVLRSRAGAGFRSLVAPGWGQVYNGQPVKAAIAGGAFVSFIVAGVAAAGWGLKSQLDYNAWTPEKLEPSKRNAAAQATATQALRDQANLSYTSAIVMVGLAFTTSLLAGADAYLSGEDADTLDAALVKN